MIETIFLLIGIYIGKTWGNKETKVRSNHNIPEELGTFNQSIRNGMQYTQSQFPYYGKQ